MSQLLTVRPDGSIVGLDFKSKGVNLRGIGRCQTDRISDIEFDDGAQKWQIRFLRPAGKYYGTVLMESDWVQKVDPVLPDGTDTGPFAQLQFREYEDAVEAEIQFIQALRRRGEML